MIYISSVRPSNMKKRIPGRLPSRNPGNKAVSLLWCLISALLSIFFFFSFQCNISDNVFGGLPFKPNGIANNNNNMTRKWPEHSSFFSWIISSSFAGKSLGLCGLESWGDNKDKLLLTSYVLFFFITSEEKLYFYYLLIDVLFPGPQDLFNKENPF